MLFTMLPSPARAFISSQAGPMGGVALSATPMNMLTHTKPNLFRIVLLRRLRQPFSLSAGGCRCCRLFDVLGHHRACARVRFLGQRGFASESVVARICREAGGRVRMVQDVDMGIPLVGTGRRSLLMVSHSSQSTPQMGAGGQEQVRGSDGRDWRSGGSCVDCFVLTFVSTVSAHDASQSLASSRHRLGANPQRTSSSISQVAEGGSAATASAWQTIKATAVSFREKPSCDRPSMPPQQMRAAATERVSRIKASIAAFRAEDTEDMTVLQVALEKAQRQAAVPPVDHRIGEVERLAEAQQVPKVPQLKNQRSTRLVEMVHPLQSSDEAAQLVLEPSAKRRAVGEDIPTNQQDLACWMVSKQLELRDALEMGDIGIIMELSQLLSKGALRMECCPSMVSNMVC